MGGIWHGNYYILNYLCEKIDTCIQFGNTLAIFEGLPTPLWGWMDVLLDEWMDMENG